MTGKMKEMQMLLEKIESTEKILGLLKDVRSHIDISVCMTHIEVTENMTNFIRTEYELKLKKLEKQWREMIYSYAEKIMKDGTDAVIFWKRQ